MKVLVLSNLYPPDVIGGYELGCKQVVEALRGRGHDARVLTIAPRTPVPAESHVLRVLKVSEVWNSNRYVLDINHRVTNQLMAGRGHRRQRLQCSRLDPGPRRLPARRGLRLDDRRHRRSGPDGDAPAPPDALALAPDGRRAGRPLPVRGEGHHAVAQGGRPPARRPVPGLLSAVGRRDRGRRRDGSGRTWTWCRTGSSARRRRLGPGSTSRAKSLRVVAAGQIAQHKGIDVLIEATAKVRELGFDNVQVDIYGNVEDHYFPTLVRRLGLDDHVTFKGSRPQAELARLYPTYDVFAFPTWHREPFAFAPSGGFVARVRAVDVAAQRQRRVGRPRRPLPQGRPDSRGVRRLDGGDPVGVGRPGADRQAGGVRDRPRLPPRRPGPQDRAGA